VFLQNTTSIWLGFGLHFWFGLVFVFFVEVAGGVHSTTFWLCVRATVEGE
jgi:hypothetical protein